MNWQIDHTSNHKLRLLVILVSLWILMSLSLNERSSLNTTVLNIQFINLDCVISTKESQNIFLIILFFVFWKVSSFKSHNILIIQKHFIEIFFDCFLCQIEYILKTVFFRSKSIVRRNRMYYFDFILFLQWNWNLLDLHVLLIPLFSEWITIMNHTFSWINQNSLSTNQILWFVMVFFL